MEGYFMCAFVALLLAGSSAHDGEEKRNSSGSFVIPIESFNLTSPPTTPEITTESITTVLVLNVSAPANLSESETPVPNNLEFIENGTTEATEPATGTEHVDLTVTDSSGCLTALKDKIEDKCHDKFESTIIDIHQDDESYNSQACCALEDYEKCALNGYKRSNCQVNQKELKNVLGSARIFIAAMTKVNCAEHKADCVSASGSNRFSLAMAALPVVLLFL